MDLESTKLQLEDEIDAKVELQKLLIKIQEESRHLRDRLEREIESKNEEIEDTRCESTSLPGVHFFSSLRLDANRIFASRKFKNN